MCVCVCARESVCVCEWVCELEQGSPTFFTPRTGYGLEKILRTGGGGSLKQVYSFILLSAHVEAASSLVSERYALLMQR